jgi:hypothetical protein
MYLFDDTDGSAISYSWIPRRLGWRIKGEQNKIALLHGKLPLLFFARRPQCPYITPLRDTAAWFEAKNDLAGDCRLLTPSAPAV